MKYRAIAIGATRDNKPLVYYSNFMPDIQDWADKISAAEKCRVEVFQSEEKLVRIINAPKAV